MMVWLLTVCLLNMADGAVLRKDLVLKLVMDRSRFFTDHRSHNVSPDPITDLHRSDQILLFLLNFLHFFPLFINSFTHAFIYI